MRALVVALLPGLLLLLPRPAAGQQPSASDGGGGGGGFIVVSGNAGLLLNFKATFANGDSVLASWAPGSSPCAGWLGVNCSADGRVTSIKLGSKGLIGAIPERGYVLPDTLLQLVLSDNYIEGSLSESWAPLPPGLEEVDLYDNRLSGSIPEGWVAALPTSLQFLAVDRNQLTGSLPRGLERLVNLETIYLSRNRLSSSISADWRLPPSLKGCKCHDNQLTGTLPPDLVLPPTLESLSLDQNLLTGTIPQQWGDSLPPMMKELFLWHNQLTGTLPSWPSHPDLDVLVLPENLNLCGAVPTSPRYLEYEPVEEVATLLGPQSLPDCAPLQLLAFKGSFSNGGEVLGSWQEGGSPCNMTAPWLGVSCNAADEVVGIDLEGAGLEGSLPRSGWPLTPELEALNLADNPLLRGGVPAWASPPPALSELQLQNCGLSGSLPPWPGNNRTRVTVYPGNALCGEVPSMPLYVQASGEALVGPLAPCPSPSPSPTPSPSPVPVASDGSSTSTGVIVGVVITGTAALVAIAALMWWRLRRRGRGLIVDFEKTAASKSEMAGEDEDTNKPLQLSPKASPQALHPEGARVEDIDLLANDPFLQSILSSLPKHTFTSTAEAKGAPSLATGTDTISRGDSGPDSSTQLAAAPSSTSAASSSKRSLVDTSMWNVPFGDIQLHARIGRGSFGVVYVGTWREIKVAVKILLEEADRKGSKNLSSSLGSDKCSPADAVLPLSRHLTICSRLEKQVQRCVDSLATSPACMPAQEAGMLAALRHDNVLAFRGICSAPPCLVLEYCERGSIFEVLRVARLNPAAAAELDWQRRLSLAAQAASGMAYLHSFNPPLIHRDLRSPNLLLTENWTVKVSDLNMSKILHDSPHRDSNSSLAVTNPRWLGPEVLQGGTHTFASDVFSFGVVLWELLTFEASWSTVSNPWQVSALVLAGHRPGIPAAEDLPAGGGSFEGLGGYIQLMERCWAEDPGQRPSFPEIIAVLRRLQGLLGGARQGSGSGPGDGSINLNQEEAVRRRITLQGGEIESPFVAAQQAALGQQE